MNLCDEYTEMFYMQDYVPPKPKVEVYTLKNIISNVRGDKVYKDPKDTYATTVKTNAKIYIYNNELCLICDNNRLTIYYNDFKHILKEDELKDLEHIVKKYNLK